MTRTKSLMLAGAALTATLAIAAFAQSAPHDHHGRMPMPTTRVELQDRITEQFKAADTNGDGFVSRAEFDARTAAMKATFEAKRAEHRADEFAMLDTNHDGAISKDEFMAPPPHGEGMRHGPGGPGGPDMPPPPPGAGPDEGGPDGGPDGPHGHGMRGHGGPMRGMGMMGGKWFDKADTNHDGKLTLAEASAWPLAMFDRSDTNHDGKISPEEHEAARSAFLDRWKGKKD